MLTYVLLISASRICVQALDRSIPDFELNSMRCGFAMVSVILYFVLTRHFPAIPKANNFEVVLVVIVINLVTI